MDPRVGRGPRIYAGIHFRDAMEDGYFIALETAQQAEELLD
ncbi:MAG: hypothetical protein ACRDQ2_04045 [Gaiellales bacterium]